MRVALIADTHLSARSPECVANFHAARRAVGRLAPDLTIHLGDITLDGQTHGEELAHSAELMRHWPTALHCVPGNHDVGDGCGEAPLIGRLLDAYRNEFGADRWKIDAGTWRLLGINAQTLGTGSTPEAELWDWIEAQTETMASTRHTALFLHRPLLRPNQTESGRQGRYVEKAAAQRLLDGPLKATLRLVVSGHTHQYLDLSAHGVRHLWMPSTAFVLPDEMQSRVGEKLTGIGLLDLGRDVAAFDLWCPDGMVRHDVSQLGFMRHAWQPTKARVGFGIAVV